MEKGGVRSMPVAAVEPGLKMIGPMSGVRLDEAFGFAIGAWSLGSSEEVAQAVALASAAELMRAVAAAVVAHDALHFNAGWSRISWRQVAPRLETTRWLNCRITRHGWKLATAR